MTHRMTSIAIVIPAYNAARTINQTLDSIAQQTRTDAIKKVVLIDDCSSDATLETARAHGCGAVALECHRNAANQGERRTVNAAFADLAHEFDWVAVLHADDFAKNNWLEVLLAASQRFPSAASICSSWDTIDEENRIGPGEDLLDVEQITIESSKEAVAGTLMKGCWWHFSGCLMNLKQFAKIGPFVADMPQLGDLEWMLRLLNTPEQVVIYVPRTLIFYRQSASNVSSTSFITSRDAREQLRIMDSYGSFLTDAQRKVMKQRWRKLLLRRTLRLTLMGKSAYGWQAFKLRRKFR
jgi:glycosyltransferase involved in cell wall biosynthesis